MSKAKRAVAAAKAKTPAAILGENLGNGEGAQKLCYLLFLADYDDDLALFLADVGAIIARADALRGEPKLTEEDRVILSKAVRLEAVLLDEDVDPAIARAIAEREGGRALVTVLRDVAERTRVVVSVSVIGAALDVVGEETPELLRPLLWAAALASGPAMLPALRSYTPRPGELRRLSTEPAALAVLSGCAAVREALERDLDTAAESDRAGKESADEQGS